MRKNHPIAALAVEMRRHPCLSSTSIEAAENFREGRWCEIAEHDLRGGHYKSPTWMEGYWVADRVVPGARDQYIAFEAPSPEKLQAILDARRVAEKEAKAIGKASRQPKSRAGLADSL